MKTIRILIFLVLACTVAGQERFVMPVDEAKDDPGFLSFRTKLIAAAERKDTKYLMSIVDPKLEYSFGGYSGLAQFRKLWKLDRPDSKFWKELLLVLRNGGIFTGEGRNRLNSFAAPYTFTSFPDDLDGFEYHAIFGSNVNLRAEPNTESPVVTMLSYNVVKVDEARSTRKNTGPGEYDFEYNWYAVETLGGKKGFVKAEFVRSPIGYRAGFEKIRGVWKITFFIAGD